MPFTRSGTLQACPRAFTALTSAATEMASCVYVDAAGRQVGARWFASLKADSVAVSIRAVVIDVLALEARSVVLAHNHPSGDVTPSALDLSFTRRLYDALAAVNVRLYDHLIVSATGLMSFRDAGLL